MEKLDDNRNRITVMADEYLEQLRARRYSPRSVETYGRALQDFIRTIKPGDARAVTGKDLEKYRANLLAREFKAASIVVYFQALKLFFRYLEEKQVIFANPAAGLPPMRMPKMLQSVPTEEEMRILLDQPNIRKPLGIRDRAMLETVYSTGLRRRELLDMQMGSVSLDEGRARVMGKGDRERVVPVGAEAVKWLKKYVEEVRPSLVRPESGEALWLGKDGFPLGYEAIQLILYHYRWAPGITTRIGLHSIRRACATHMLRRGASPVAIQFLLGHAALDHLGQYLQVTINDLKLAHEQSKVGQ